MPLNLAAPEAESRKPGESGHHHRPGRGLGNRRRPSEEFGDIDLAVPCPDPRYILRVGSAVERAAAAPAAAKDALRRQRVEKVPFSSTPAAIAAAAPAAQAERTNIAGVLGGAPSAPAAKPAAPGEARVTPVVPGAALTLRKAAKADVVFRSAGAIALEAAAAPAPLKPPQLPPLPLLPPLPCSNTEPVP